MPSWAVLEWLKHAICSSYMTLCSTHAASDRTEDKRAQVPEDTVSRADSKASRYSVWTSNVCTSKSQGKVLHNNIPCTEAQLQNQSPTAGQQSPCGAPAVAAVAKATTTIARSRIVSRTDLNNSPDNMKVLPVLADDRLSPAVAAIAAMVKAATSTQGSSTAVSSTYSKSSQDNTEVLPLLAHNKLSPAVAAIAAMVEAPATPTQGRSRAVSRTDSTCSLEVIETLPTMAHATLSLLATGTPATAPALVAGPATTAALAAGTAVAVEAVSPVVEHMQPVLTAAYALPAALTAVPAAHQVVPAELTAPPAASPAVPAGPAAGTAAYPAVPAAPPAVYPAVPAAAPAAPPAVPAAATAAPAASPAVPAANAVQPLMAAASAISNTFVSNHILSYGIASSQNTRKYQEDRAVAAMLQSTDPQLSQGERLAVAAVFDGHGGAAAAEHLQQHMVCTLQEKLQQNSLTPDAALAAAVADLEEQLMTGQCNSGSTLTAVLVKDDSLFIANVGDSRAVLCRDGKAEPLTSDHKATCQQEKARVLAADPSADITTDGYCYGLGVTRDLGNYELKVISNSKGLTAVPETSIQQLQKTDDFVLIASDGLYDTLRNNDAVNTVRRALVSKPGDCTAAAQAAVDRAIALGSSDNVTAVVLLLHSRPLQLPKSNSRLFRNRSASSSSSSSSSGTSGSDSSSGGSSGGSCSGTAGDSNIRCQ